MPISEKIVHDNLLLCLNAKTITATWWKIVLHAKNISTLSITTILQINPSFIVWPTSAQEVQLGNRYLTCRLFVGVFICSSCKFHRKVLQSELRWRCAPYLINPVSKNICCTCFISLIFCPKLNIAR